MILMHVNFFSAQSDITLYSEDMGLRMILIIIYNYDIITIIERRVFTAHATSYNTTRVSARPECRNLAEAIQLCCS